VIWRSRRSIRRSWRWVWGFCGSVRGPRQRVWRSAARSADLVAESGDQRRDLGTAARGLEILRQGPWTTAQCPGISGSVRGLCRWAWGSAAWSADHGAGSGDSSARSVDHGTVSRDQRLGLRALSLSLGISGVIRGPRPSVQGSAARSADPGAESPGFRR